MLATLQSKLIVYGLLLAGLTGGFFWVKNAFDERAQGRIKIEELTMNNEALRAGALMYQENNERQVKIIEDSKRENDELKSKVNADERGVNTGTRIVRVKATCPATSTTSANSSSAQAYAILDPAARADYFNLKRGIIDLESNYALCLQILTEDRRQKNTPPK